jgi:hypothetical protein
MRAGGLVRFDHPRQPWPEGRGSWAFSLPRDFLRLANQLEELGAVSGGVVLRVGPGKSEFFCEGE